MKITHTILALAAITGTASAASVGVSFGGESNGIAETALLTSTDVAGVVPQANWNNALGGTPDSDGALDNALDSTGAVTGLDVRWDSDESWSAFGGGATTEARLNSGWLSMNTTGNRGTVDILEIPYSTYDLYIYVGHDRVDANATFGETNGAFATTSITENFTDITAAEDPFVYVEGSGGTGNYIVFEGLTADTLNIEFYNDSDNRTTFAGFQIVDIPEPSSIALLGLGGLALLRRRRK